MNYWEYRDAKAARREARQDRKDARHFLMVERGLDARSIIVKAVTQWDPRFLIALGVISLFAWAYARNPTDEVMIGALIGAFAGAWGYYLGSSSNAAVAGARSDKQLQLASALAAQLPPPPKTEPDISLKPGEEATIAGKNEGEPGGEGDPPAKP